MATKRSGSARTAIAGIRNRTVPTSTEASSASRNASSYQRDTS